MTGEDIFLVAYPCWDSAPVDKANEITKIMLEAISHQLFDFHEFQQQSAEKLFALYEIVECLECEDKFLECKNEDPVDQNTFCSDDCQELYGDDF